MFNASRHIAQGLGFSPAASRTTTPVPAWALALVPKPDKKTVVLKAGNEDVETDTIPAIKRIVRETLSQTKRLAVRLKGTSLEQTLRNYTNFILQHIRYVKDAAGKEQLREPARTIYDGKGDCDCFAILLSSLLTNAKIAHQFKTIKQNGNTGWSHIYVVVPKPGGGYYTLDPVTNQFDTEPSFTKDKTYPMALERLSGLGAEAEAAARPCRPRTLASLEFFVPTKQVLNADLVPTREFLIDEKIPFVENGSTVTLATPKGALTVPSIITPAQADVVKQVATVTPETNQPAVEQKKAGFGWLFGLLVGGAFLSTLSDPKKAATKVASGGLAGVKHKTKSTNKRKRPKYATLHL